MTRILKINPINPQKDRIDEAARVIAEGGIVVFPTETVYGIGADALNAKACSRIFEIKGRPRDNPLIVHISKIKQLNEVARDVSDEFIRAAAILWPGPVTFILKKNYNMPDEVTAGLDTVAVRMPAHPIALRLIDAAKRPIAAPSANPSQRPSATRAEHVIADFDGKVDVIIDGGDSAFGLESTIINFTVKPHVLLRPGAFTIEELEKFLGKIEISKSINTQMSESDVAIAPGMKYRHYAPKKILIAVRDRKLLVEAAKTASRNKKIAVLCSNETSEMINGNAKIIKLGSENSLYEISKNLFDSFRKLDTMDVDFAFIQTFPERGIGLALMNRIIKASGSRQLESIGELKMYT